MKNTIAFSLLCCNLAFMPLTAQQMTAFEKVGQGEESVQEFFPGEHRARPVMGAYTDSERMGLFSGGQDLGGSSGWYTDTRWGDLGDGTFANPILNGDYSDPDVIRVGRKYYMTCSEFHFMGMNILESDDMVNWKIIGRIFDRMDLDGYSGMDKYGNGSWAPALRYHDGKFWMYVCTPNEGLFMSTATDPAGPWSPLYQVKNVSGWEDPCPLWDEDGQAYIGRSQLGGGPIIIHKMSADGKTLLDDGRKVYEGPTAEGTKLFLKDGYYYISIPEGGVGTGWQTVMRSKNIYGPYEQKRVLEMGSTKVNGPHQGALVDTPEGEWWFYHFQSTEPQGRVVHLQPVTWKDGFPEMGTDYDKNGIGEPMKVCRKPSTGVETKAYAPQASDDFEAKELGLQWQFNHNPHDEYGKTGLAGHQIAKGREAAHGLQPVYAKDHGIQRRGHRKNRLRATDTRRTGRYRMYRQQIRGRRYHHGRQGRNGYSPALHGNGRDCQNHLFQYILGHEQGHLYPSGNRRSEQQT